MVKTSWDGLPPALTSGKIDAIIAGMSPTPDRRKTIDFSNPYYISNLTMVVRKDAVSYMDILSGNSSRQRDYAVDVAVVIRVTHCGEQGTVQEDATGIVIDFVLVLGAGWSGAPPGR